MPQLYTDEYLSELEKAKEAARKRGLDTVQYEQDFNAFSSIGQPGAMTDPTKRLDFMSGFQNTGSQRLDMQGVAARAYAAGAVPSIDEFYRLAAPQVDYTYEQNLARIKQFEQFGLTTELAEQWTAAWNKPFVFGDGTTGGGTSGGGTTGGGGGGTASGGSFDDLRNIAVARGEKGNWIWELAGPPEEVLTPEDFAKKLKEIYPHYDDISPFIRVNPETGEWEELSGEGLHPIAPKGMPDELAASLGMIPRSEVDDLFNDLKSVTPEGWKILGNNQWQDPQGNIYSLADLANDPIWGKMVRQALGLAEILPDGWKLTGDGYAVSPEGVSWSMTELVDIHNAIENEDTNAFDAIVSGKQEELTKAAEKELQQEVKDVLETVFPAEKVNAIWASIMFDPEMRLFNEQTLSRTPQSEAMLKYIFPDITIDEMRNIFHEQYIPTYDEWVKSQGSYQAKFGPITLPWTISTRKDTSKAEYDKYVEALQKVPVAVRATTAGFGQLADMIAGSAKWLGADGIADYLSKEADPYMRLSIGLDADPNKFTWQDFYVGVFQALPTTLMLMPLGVGVGLGAKALGAGKFGQAVFGSAVMSGAESALEAGAVYDQALSQGLSPTEASDAAQQTFLYNMGLLGASNTAQLAAFFIPGFGLKNAIARGLVNVGGQSLTEAGEEAVQEAISRSALGQEVKLDAAMWAAISIGGAMGAGFGGASVLYDRFTTKVVDNLPPEIKTEYDQTVADSIAQDEPTAKQEGLDAVTETHEKEVTVAVEAAKQESLVEDAEVATGQREYGTEGFVKAQPLNESQLISLRNIAAKSKTSAEFIQKIQTHVIQDVAGNLSPFLSEYNRQGQERGWMYGAERFWEDNKNAPIDDITTITSQGKSTVNPTATTVKPTTESVLKEHRSQKRQQMVAEARAKIETRKTVTKETKVTPKEQPRVATAAAPAIAMPRVVTRETLVRRSDVINDLREKLDVVIRRGKFRSKALGIYKTGKEIIRFKHGDVQTVSHEVGHLLDERYKLSKGIPTNERTELLKGYPDPKDAQAEAFGEYLRYYITNPAKLAGLSFNKTFEQFLNQYPEIKNTLSTARNDYQRWQRQPSTAKVASQINMEEPQGSRSVKDVLDRLFIHLYDDMYAIQKFTNLAVKEGVKFDDAGNPALLTRLIKGIRGKANIFFEKGTLYAKNPWEGTGANTRLKIKGKSLQDIVAPVKENLDDMRIYLVSRRTVQLAEREIETGISVIDAQQSIRELESAHPEFKKVAEDLYIFQYQVLEYARDAGLINADTLARLQESSKDYVPFYRVIEELQSQGHMGKKLASVSQEIKRIKGSEREIIDPFESIVKNTYAIINSADRNAIGMAMANIASKNIHLGQMMEEIPTPMTKVAQVSAKDLGVDIEGMSEEDVDATINIFRPAMFNNKDNVVSVLIGGKRKFYQVTPELYQALMGMETEDVAMIFKILSYPAKWLRAGAVLTPDFFVAKNPIRDMFSAFVYSKHGFIPIYDGARGLFEVIKKGKDYDLWRASGGERSMLVSMDRQELKKSFNEIVEGKKFTDYVKHPLEVLQILSEYTEAANRMGEFKRALSKGETPLQAAQASRDITLDFAIMGGKTRAVNMIKAFFNANMRAQEKLVREAMHNPGSFYPKVLIGITLPSILLYLANRDEDWWKETPQWQKDLFWMFRIGDNGPIIRIPKPFELGIIFGSVPERALEWMDNKDAVSIDNLRDAVLGGFGLSPDMVTPTAFEPLIENLTNYDFFLGRNIVPESEEDLLPELQYSIYTPEMFKQLGDWLGYSPRKIENLFRGYTAGLGSYVVDTVDAILKGTGIVPNISEPSPTWADIPVIKSLIARDPYGSGSTSVDSLYTTLEKLTQGEQALKQWLAEGNVEKYNEYLKDHPETMFFYDYENGSFYSASARYMRTVTSTLSDIRKLQQEVYTNSDLSPDEKRAKIDELNKLMTDTSANALAHLKVMPEEFSKTLPVQPDRSNYYDYLSALPKSLRDTVWDADWDEETAGKYLGTWNENYDSWKGNTDLYYTDTKTMTSRQKEMYRASHWEVDVALNLLGYVTTTWSTKAKTELRNMAKLLGIPENEIPALKK